MAALALTLAPAHAAHAGQPDAAVDMLSDDQQVQQAIDAVYAAISGPVGQPRNWDSFRERFAEDARLFAITPRGVRGGTVEDYIAMSGASLVAFGFTEQELVNRIALYGNLAQVWSSYEGRFTREGKAETVRGINSFQLRRQPDGSWKVHSLLWQQETPEFAMPEDMLRSAQ
jgi:surface antigen